MFAEFTERDLVFPNDFSPRMSSHAVKFFIARKLRIFLRRTTFDTRHSICISAIFSFGIRLARAHNAYAVVREVRVHLRNVNFGHVA